MPDSGTTSVIEINDLTQIYDKKKGPVLENINLQLGTGLFGLLGANGAGKSTLMRIICTLLVPTSGTVKVYGHDVVKECHKVRPLLGYLPQEFGAWRLHRVEEVLSTLAQISGLTNRRERREKVAETLESVGLAEVAGRKIKKLSGGMLRRLGVAQALIHDPEVIVVDEPTVGLDPEERMRFRSLMSQLGRERTIILSTHIVADLGTGCSEIALIDDGHIAFRGTPHEMLSQTKGYVYEIEAHEEQHLDGAFEIVSREGAGENATLHIVVEDMDALSVDAQEVTDPTLEEAYLSFMASRSKLGSASQHEPEATEGKSKRWKRKSRKKQSPSDIQESTNSE